MPLVAVIVFLLAFLILTDSGSVFKCAFLEGTPQSRLGLLKRCCVRLTTQWNLAESLQDVMTRGGCKARKTVRWREARDDAGCKAQLIRCVSPLSSFSPIIKNSDSSLLFLKIGGFFKRVSYAILAVLLELLIFLHIGTEYGLFH